VEPDLRLKLSGFDPDMKVDVWKTAPAITLGEC
jgi:hypothetical protein